MELFGFSMIVVLAIGVAGCVLDLSIASARRKVIAAVETEAKLIHRRIDDLTGEIQLLLAETNKIERSINDPARVVKFKEAGREHGQRVAYDYESSQRATLEEFKEQ